MATCRLSVLGDLAARIAATTRLPVRIGVWPDFDLGVWWVALIAAARCWYDRELLTEWQGQEIQYVRDEGSAAAVVVHVAGDCAPPPPRTSSTSACARVTILIPEAVALD